MSPETALEQHILRYRAMTGEQRLRIALELHEFACNVAREGIRNQRPDADDQEVERQLRARIELSRKWEPKASFLLMCSLGGTT